MNSIITEELVREVFRSISEDEITPQARSDTVGERAARQGRIECNKLTKREHERLIMEAMALIHGGYDGDDEDNLKGKIA